MNNGLIFHSIPFLLKGALKTVEIAFVAIVLGLLGGVVLGALNSKEGTRCRPLQIIIRAFVELLRGTPLFIQILIVYYAVPEMIGVSFTPFAAGVIALGLNSTAYISEIVRGGIDALPQGQWEAAYVTGLNRWQTFKGIIIPQVVSAVLPSLVNELVTLIKETSILMAIGVAELTKVSKEIVARELDPMTIYLAAALIYLSMTLTIGSVAKWASHKCARNLCPS